MANMLLKKGDIEVVMFPAGSSARQMGQLSIVRMVNINYL